MRSFIKLKTPNGVTFIDRHRVVRVDQCDAEVAEVRFSDHTVVEVAASELDRLEELLEVSDEDDSFGPDSD